MGTITYTLPTPTVTPNSLADPQLVAALNTLLTALNGNIDFVNLSGALQSQVNSGTVGPRGATNIAASESRTNTAYGTLTTPDQVTGLVLPTNGLIAVWYQATWQESVGAAARAAIFVGANQVQVALTNNTAPNPQAATTNAGVGAVNNSIASFSGGLLSGQAQVYTGDITTGQVMGVGSLNTNHLYQDIAGTIYQVDASAAGGIVQSFGGPCYIFAAAGTYTVSVQFKASSGSVTASNRKLWVQVQAFS